MTKKPLNQKQITAELVAAEAMAALSAVEREMCDEMRGDQQPRPATIEKLRAAFMEKERAIRLAVEAELEENEQERISRVPLRRAASTAPPLRAVQEQVEVPTPDALLEFAQPVSEEEARAAAIG